MIEMPQRQPPLATFNHSYQPLSPTGLPVHIVPYAYLINDYNLTPKVSVKGAWGEGVSGVYSGMKNTKKRTRSERAGKAHQSG